MQGMGKVDASLDKSGVKVDDEAPSTSAAPKPPARTGPKGSQGKRKGRK
jgi:hypothetical protein